MDEKDKELASRGLERANHVLIPAIIVELLNSDVLSQQQVQTLLDRALTSLEQGDSPQDHYARQYVEGLQAMIGSLRKR